MAKKVSGEATTELLKIVEANPDGISVADIEKALSEHFRVGRSSIGSNN